MECIALSRARLFFYLTSYNSDSESFDDDSSVIALYISDQ